MKSYDALADPAPWIVVDGAGQTPLKPNDFAWFQYGGGSVKASLVPAGPYEDSYAYKPTGLPNISNLVSCEMGVTFDATSDLSAAEAFEFEVQLQDGISLYNGGVQANFPLGLWRVFNKTTNTWQKTPLQLPTKAQWLAGVSVQANYCFGNTASTFVSLVVNGVEHPLWLQYPAPKATKTEFNVAWQLDGNQAAQAFSVLIHKCKVYAL